ncbi:MAG: class I SAM-dependent methyltransferase [Lachnospiraceae bacterium]|nr:class I SAM-dependent methyltransferase [Lachnospiraceae bacterium]
MEKIGKVTLDYSKYPGEDFYCDGEVEDRLLEIAKTQAPEEYPAVIEEAGSWPILYHLSALRENIVEWIPMGPGAKVLEVGSGCGAITGVLSRKAGSVTCVELSKKRSEINAYRHKESDNITIRVGNFKDIEPELPEDYDYIFLIGVLEYADSYIGGKTPHEEFIRILRKHLASKGRLVIAIENQYGLKYFAGCREDHTGEFFEGIEGYPAPKGVRTFGRDGLAQVLQRAGEQAFHFYYPYPDYKFMHSLYSDAYLPKAGELSDNLRNFDRDRLVLFDEKHVFDGMIREGVYPFFANSFLVVVGQELPVQYARYSNERAPQYAICTRIEQQDGRLTVRKYPLGDAARDHINGTHMAEVCQELSARYAGGKLLVNQCLSGQGSSGETAYSEFEFVRGTSLAERMDEMLFRNDIEGFYELFDEYVERVSYRNEAYQGKLCSRDLIFSNILVEGDRWTLIDYEWTTEEEEDIRRWIYKAVYCYLLEDGRREVLDRSRVLQKLSLTPVQAAETERAEMAFQQQVTGGRATLAQLREKMAHPAVLLGEMLKCGMGNGATKAQTSFQVYEDTGEGFREAQSYSLPEVRVESGEIKCKIKIPQGVKRVRLDPGSRFCAVKLREIVFQGKALALRDDKQVAVNGTRLKSSDVILFDTEDPNITVDLTKLKREQAESVGSEDQAEPDRDAAILEFRARVEILSGEMVEELIRAKRPFF